MAKTDKKTQTKTEEKTPEQLQEIPYNELELAEKLDRVYEKLEEVIGELKGVRQENAEFRVALERAGVIRKPTVNLFPNKK